MIKINLLPKEIEQKAAARQKIMLIAGIGGIFLLIFIGGYFLRVTKLTSLKGRIAEIEKELKKLEPIVQKVNNIKANKDALNSKIKVIKNLMKSRLLYPIFMEDFAAILPPKVWITGLNTKSGDNILDLNFKVLARDNYAVADFINDLEVSRKFQEIKFAGITTTSQVGEEIRSFSISCSYSPAGEVIKKTKKKPRRKRR